MNREIKEVVIGNRTFRIEPLSIEDLRVCQKVMEGASENLMGDILMKYTGLTDGLLNMMTNSDISTLWNAMLRFTIEKSSGSDKDDQIKSNPPGAPASGLNVSVEDAKKRAVTAGGLNVLIEDAKRRADRRFVSFPSAHARRRRDK